MIRFATAVDLPAIVALIRGLVEYERLAALGALGAAVQERL